MHDLHGEPGRPFEALMSMPSDALEKAPARMEITVEKVWFDDNSVWRRGHGPMTEYQTNALPQGRSEEHTSELQSRI